MMNKAHDNPPPRLIESSGSDVGSLLRNAMAVTFDEDRLAENRRALLLRIRENARPKPGWWWIALPPRRRLTLVALTVTVLISAGAAAVIYIERVVNPPPAAGPDEDGRKTSRARTSSGRTRRLLSKAEQRTPNDAQPVVAAMDAGATPLHRARGKGRRALPDSTLDEQVALFNKAKSRLAIGAPQDALAYLNRLRQRYPEGPLTLESKELTAHALARLHRYRDATKAVNTLLRAKVSTRKKAQLYRFLGDLQVKQNQCDKAVESYRRALGIGLPAAESDAARAGIRNCAL